MTNTTKKTAIIEVSGGFHNAHGITFRVDREAAQDVISGDRLLYDALSESQLKRADKHICGISDCQCGGCHGKDVEVAIIR